MTINETGTSTYPRCCFAYRNAIHEATRYTPFHVTFGCSPILPVDIMMRVPVNQKESMVLDFVCYLNCSLKNVNSQVHENIKVTHHHNKAKYDQHTTYTHFSIGDQVWLYVPAVKTGWTKKLASLWRGTTNLHCCWQTKSSNLPDSTTWYPI